ncbi:MULTISPECIES: alpha/beta hydrolase [unclassified Pseudodesulfovibrio]|uniref:alpha/beta fold hydrolase n=1 Tax=unclassified Pseudodesulfovibrio TaxID=2661612 RepID=UPI000FEBE2F4|nr:MULTISPECIES: alpha/beta hydrolase [unclassified Pseudodesulfovibrio]MCJ2165242.1 alpha/beta fold hydrolase [Pseudodesulfovibrio sp. S3-i]RWU03294.1 alpha/beta hydrolase [Pseudodesulfovibrio sp. S3]
MNKIIKTESVEICAKAFGNLDNTPVLLIAGAMAPAVFWETKFCESLSARGYCVIRFDNRDIGRSTHFPQNAPGSGIELPYTIYDMVTDAKNVLESITDKSCHIIGHSLGGAIAQLFAVTYPEKIISLTAISSPILAKGNIPFVETDPRITEELWGILMANPMYQDVNKGLREFQKIWRALNGDWVLDEEMAEKYTRTIYETEIIGPAWNHTNVQSGIRDIFQELKEIDKPLLFIHGEKDYLPSNPENTKRLAKSLPTADFFLLKKAGHMFFSKDIWLILIERIHEHLQKGHNKTN